jgi:ABC-type molybdate transport system substrate-binding protein
MLNQSKFPDLARRFIELVKSSQGQAVLEKYGFEMA